MLYSIADLFHSIQGEGYWTGRSAYFIRLAGCNLQCSFCDTDHRETQRLDEVSIATLVNDVFNGKPGFVVITGGEPTLQDLFPLVDELKKNKHYIAVETNGLLMDKIPGKVDWITLSPKKFVHYKWKGVFAHEVKLPHWVGEEPLFGVIENQIVSGKLRTLHKFVQPVHTDNGMENKANIKLCLNRILANPDWRLSLQTQLITRMK